MDRIATCVQKSVVTVFYRCSYKLNPCRAGTEYKRFQAWSIEISLNSMLEMSVFHKYKYFSSFEARNCVSKSSFKWLKNTIETIQHHKGYNKILHTKA